MLDDEDRVAVVPQLSQDLEEPGRLLRMKADRGLVEDIENAAEPASGLGGQPDALGLAARKGRGLAVERQVAESQAQEKVRPFQDGVAEGRAGGPFPAARIRSPGRNRRAPGWTAGVVSAMFLPRKVTLRASGLSRRPPQARQGMVRANRRMLRFLFCLRMASMTGRMPL